MNIRRTGVFSFFFLLFLAAANFASVDFSRTVQEVKIVGLARLDAKDIPETTALFAMAGRKILESELVRNVNALYLSGYFHSVNAETRNLENEVQLIFNVEENPLIRRVVFQGNNVFPGGALVDIMRNKPGHVFNIRFLQEDQQTLETFYHSKGYDLCKIIRSELKSGGDLVIELSEGQVEEIRVSGQKRLPENIITRDLETRKGGVFNSAALRRDREYLLRLGYFSDVSAPQIKEGSDPGRVVIVFSVQEAKANKLDLGLETEIDRTLAFLKEDINHVLIPSDLVSGKIQVGSAFQNGVDARGYSLHYFEPWILNLAPVSIAFDVWSEEHQEQLSDPTYRGLFFADRRQGGSITLAVPLIRNLLTYSNRFRVEYVSLEGDPPSGATVDPYALKSVSAILNYSSVTNPYNPASGTYWRLEGEKGGDLRIVKLGGLDFYRLSLDAATFFSLTDQDIIGLHGSSGAFLANNLTSLTFESEGFEVGGFNSLRGFQESHPFLGPRKLLFNAEYRHNFNSFFQGALFVDVGKAFNGPVTFDWDSFAHGAGFGFRFFTPLGPIRLDFGFPEGRLSPLSQMIIHFSIGQMF